MKKNKRITRFLFCLLIFVGGWLFLHLYGHPDKVKRAANETSASVGGLLFNRENLHVEIECGLEKEVRCDRYMQLTASVRNMGKRFTGSLRVEGVGENSGKVYEKQIEIDSHAKKQYEMYLPVTEGEEVLQVSVYHGQDRQIYEGKIRLEPKQDKDIVYVGIYSDRQDELRYMDSVETNVIYLSERDIPDDFRGLNLLDVLIIDSADLQTMQEKQSQALINWVRLGGTLVLADSGEEREITAFRGRLIEWKKQGSSRIKTSFGVDKEGMNKIRSQILRERTKEKQQEVKEYLRNNLSDELYEKWKSEINNIQNDVSCLQEGGEIYNYLSRSISRTVLSEFLPLTLTRAEKKAALEEIESKEVKRNLQELEIKGSKVLLKSRKGRSIIQKKEVGKGAVLVSGVSLALPTEVWEVQGRSLRNLLLDNRTTGQQLFETATDRKNADKLYDRGLQITEWNKMPNLKLYIVLFGIYILLIGPVLWWWISGKKQKIIVWAVIPVAAGVFVMLIYLTGTSTRLESTYVNYMNQIELDENGIGNIESRFRMINGSRKVQEAAISGGMLMDYADSQKIRGKLLLQQGEGKNTLQLGEIPSFQGIDMRSVNTVRFEGNLTGKLFMANMQLGGRIENHLEYPLEDCVLYYNGVLYYMGSVKKQETIRLREVSPSLQDQYVFDRYVLEDYSRDYDLLAQKLFRVKRGTVSKEVRKKRWIMLQAYLCKKKEKKAFFYGFVPAATELAGWYDTNKAKQQNILAGIEQLSGEKYGETGVAVELPVDGEVLQTVSEND